MPNLTLVITDQIKKKMSEHPNIRWSNAVREIIVQKIEDFEVADRLAKKGNLTQSDFKIISKKIEMAAAKHARKLLNESHS
ncbi:MAG: hypothetical protein Q7S21_04995 [archaeon]|nr:hypothetical protein [archaeon]